VPSPTGRVAGRPAWSWSRRSGTVAGSRGPERAHGTGVPCARVPLPGSAVLGGAAAEQDEPGGAGGGQRRTADDTVYVHPDADVLAHLVALVDSGDLHVDIARRVPLEELPAIHQQADAGQLHGEVVAVPPAP